MSKCPGRLYPAKNRKKNTGSSKLERVYKVPRNCAVIVNRAGKPKQILIHGELDEAHNVSRGIIEYMCLCLWVSRDTVRNNARRYCLASKMLKLIGISHWIMQ